MSESIQFKAQIPMELSEQRVDVALTQLMPQHSRARIQSWIKNEELTLNGKACKTKDKVVVGDTVCLEAEIIPEGVWIAQEMPLDIVFEDEAIIVVNKAAGVVVHPAAGNLEHTLVNGLLYRYPELDRLPRAGIVHRLDKDTTGLMVVARSLEAHTSLVDQLQRRTMGRIYQAIVSAGLPASGTIEQPIGRHPKNRLKMAVVSNGKPAITHYRCLEDVGSFDLLECRLETGRTHQIRVHFSHLGHPLLGDPVYGMKPSLRLPQKLRDAIDAFDRQALHAIELRLIHPTSNQELSWRSDLPEDMQQMLLQLRACADESAI